MPKTRTKFEPLPENIDSFFSKDVSELVSNKLPGYQVEILFYSTRIFYQLFRISMNDNSSNSGEQKNHFISFDLSENSLFKIMTDLFSIFDPNVALD